MSAVKSRLYVGEVNHTRCGPVVHRFSYPFYTYALDLAELPLLRKQLRFFGHNKFNLVSLYDKDYIPGKEGTIEEKLRSYLSAKGISRSITRIELITGLRYFGYIFNPVNFYRCFGEDGSLVAAVAEVNNTFGETHLYILDELTQQGAGSFASATGAKEFHVSPFNDMKGDYRFYFSDSPDRLDIRVNMVKDGKTVFTSQLCGDGVLLNSKNLLKTIGAYPITALLTVPRITAQAIKLSFGKKLPVYTKPIASSPMTIQTVPPSWYQKLCVSLGFRFLSSMKHGCLTLSFPDGTEHVFGDRNSDLKATMFIRNYDFFLRSILFGDIGFGESYVDGQWDADSLTNVLRIFLENEEDTDDRSIFFSYLGRVVNTLRHLIRDNSRTGSKKNISAHYDMSNDLFSTFLDPSMTYSCGYYATPHDDLATCQKNKIQRIIDKARITKADHVLEIGCGWGSFAITAAKQTGCRVTGLTLSQEQQKLARERAEAEGVSHLVDFQLKDYRDVREKYDKIVSIEMLEAVGHRHLGDFFATCDRVLHQHGLAVLQVITFPDYKYGLYRRGCDWIQKYIFPGGLCPSMTAMSEAISKRSKFVVEDIENIGVHYARTLAEWRVKFDGSHKKLKLMGFDDNFNRIWHYYLSYCEAGFATRFLGTMQIVLTRTKNKSLPLAPGY